MSSPLSTTPYSSSTICASSTRSRESMSSSSNVASDVISLASGPKLASASTTRSCTCSLVTALIEVSSFFVFQQREPSGGQTAIDCKHRAGHTARLLRHEEAYASRHLFCSAGPLRGYRAQQLGADQLGGHVGGDESGGHGVDRHATPRDLDGRGARELHQARFGRSVVALPRIGAQPADRRDIHNA